MSTSDRPFHPTFALDRAPEANHLWFCVHESQVLVGPPDDLGLVVSATHFIGELGGVGVWASEVADARDIPFTNLRALYGQLDEQTWILAGRAVQIVEWDRTHRFCGRCGTPTEHSATDRSRKCPSCALLAYPRLAPAVITLVTRGDDEVLLARGANFPVPMYSCIAGFVEPGETLEQAVVREVHEEVGVVVAPPTYVRSQPWPFPHSLMIGFTTEWISGEIEIDPVEILDAQWYRRDALPMTPPTMSIAGRLIESWTRGTRS